MRTAAGLALIAASLLATACNKAPAGSVRPTGDVPQAVEQDTSSEAGPAIPGNGTLQVWVPAGAIDHRFWIYLNGRLHHVPGASDTMDANPYFGINREGTGWTIFGDGFQTNVIHDEWGSGNLSEDTWLKLFEAVDLSVPQGDYTVELLVESRGTSTTDPSFPFAITRARTTAVQAGKRVRFVAGIPDKWEPGLIAAVASARPWGQRCRLGAGLPDLDALMVKVKAYQADPVANALRGATEIDQRHMFLKLPPSLGGAREFEGAQLKKIVAALSAASHFPRDQDVTDCQQAYPDFSSSYREYGLVLQQVQGEIDGFQREADRLSSASPS